MWFMIRVSCFVDGFNLYHALKRLNGPHLLWTDLWRLTERQLKAKTETLVHVYYFSAFATWLPDERARHEQYVNALAETGVTVVMGHFKKKDRHCPKCHHSWKGHEEKETDVNIALSLLNEAYLGSYDKALVVSRDSDLKPAVRLVLQQFPKLNVTIVAPPELGHSTDLISVATEKRKITRAQVEACLLPETVSNATGTIVARRPTRYDPPPKN